VASSAELGGGSGPQSRGQSATSAGSRGVISIQSTGSVADNAETDVPSERMDEEDKESHVVNGRGGAASKQESIAIMKKYNIKTA